MVKNNSKKEIDFRSIVNDYPDHIIILDKELIIQFVNYPSPGLTIDDLIGTPLYQYVEEERRNEIKSILVKVLETGESSSYGTEYDTPDGKKIYYESKVIPQVVDEKVVGLLLSARDVTKRIEAEKQVKILSGLLPICASCKRIRNEEG
ncbi:MAG: PAS domain S-box protein, partial [Candidatus Kariarchaeaceae archaeon]